ncbi:hypothetical protein RHSIM_Rhsim11G0102700 [Rhododendron simsii]|uniref:PGG domain-containing protein n=1 Tax=Rhododendron simsii TaxID=118357 RepID=A0A834G7B5_RHOSS|nr:hypothetical protein RHSIM_Rhsim11G0102700 [Rhododendron simsii]
MKESFDFNQLLPDSFVVLDPFCEEVDLLLQVVDIDLELVAGPVSRDMASAQPIGCVVMNMCCLSCLVDILPMPPLRRLWLTPGPLTSSSWISTAANGLIGPLDVPVKLEKCSKDHNIGDVESPPINISQATKVHRDNQAQSFGEDNSTSVPQIKHIRERKLVHFQALQLVNSLCEKIKSLNDIDAYHTIAKTAIMIAAKTGIPEVVEEIAEWFPTLIWTRDSENRNLFHQAIIYRHENIFSLIYQMSDHKYFATNFLDKFGNSMLHLAGQLAPPNKLNLVPGAALQMQRELQWLKEVEKFLYPGYREMKNAKEETPAMVFTREHKNLVVAGEKLMKDTATSCTIVAALIATVVFAAAITVPGGNNGDNGLPIFSKRKAFIIFAVSDALSLFTSATSLLMFLSILTSRYAEGDFLYALPKRLIIGLVTLFLSITAMMVAFSCTLYLVFGHKKAWTLIPVATLACLPVTSFVSLQFPLLVDVISSTYGPGIFGKQSNRPFY